jgi:hypothetical protein
MLRGIGRRELHASNAAIDPARLHGAVLMLATIAARSASLRNDGCASRLMVD